MSTPLLYHTVELLGEELWLPLFKAPRSSLECINTLVLRNPSPLSQHSNSNASDPPAVKSTPRGIVWPPTALPCVRRIVYFHNDNSQWISALFKYPSRTPNIQEFIWIYDSTSSLGNNCGLSEKVSAV